MARDQRTGRYTAERTTTTREVTERLTYEPPPPGAVAGDPSPLFTRLLSDPPAGARWAHPGFTAYLAARPGPAVLPPAEAPAAPAGDTAPVPVIRVVEVPRTLPGLDEATLAHEFTEDDRAALTAVLGPGEVIA